MNSQKHILIVEDEEYLLDAYQGIFPTDQFVIDTARDGQEALEKIDTGVYDVYILDLLLPKQNGLEVLRYIRSKPDLKTVPIIVASNVDKKETIDEALAGGATTVFIKSEVRLADLLATVQKLLGLAA